MRIYPTPSLFLLADLSWSEARNMVQRRSIHSNNGVRTPSRSLTGMNSETRGTWYCDMTVDNFFSCHKTGELAKAILTEPWRKK